MTAIHTATPIGKLGCASVLIAWFVCASTPAYTQTPLGPEIRLDKDLVADFGMIQETARDVTLTADGPFIVTWRTLDSVTPYVRSNIAARRFDAGGRSKGPDFIVNTYTTGQQDTEAIASDDAGNFVVVWGGETPSGIRGVLGQRFDAAGARIGGEFQVNANSSTFAFQPFVAMRPGGEFVVVWTVATSGPTMRDIYARQFDASGLPVSGEFRVNTYTTDDANVPSVDFDGAGNFVVAWGQPVGSTYATTISARLFNAAGAPQGAQFVVHSGDRANPPRVARAGDGSFVVAWQQIVGGDLVVTARRYDAGGSPIGGKFSVGATAPFQDFMIDVDADADGDFVIVWEHQYDIMGRRFDSSGVGGPQFQVSDVWNSNFGPSVSSDPAGNFVVVWRARLGYSGVGAFARRYAAGLSPADLTVDSAASPSSDGNSVLEAGETVVVTPSWLNANFGAETFTGAAASFVGQGAPGDPSYTIADGAAAYGTVAANAIGRCDATSDCYALGISTPTTRPAAHWDATFREVMAPANLGASKNWAVHVGDSFDDVPRAAVFYRFVETMLHHGVTAGCGTSTYCPASWTSRAQMAVFVLIAKDGPGNVPPACGTAMFADVPAASPFCPWIEELARRGVVGGCGGGNYCPGAPVSRDQVAVFVLLTKEPGVTPPVCGVPMFNDVPATSPFCRWIEELARRGVVTGCGGGNYCPTAEVTREQMAVFVSAGFGLQLYGP